MSRLIHDRSPHPLLRILARWSCPLHAEARDLGQLPLKSTLSEASGGEDECVCTPERGLIHRIADDPQVPIPAGCHCQPDAAARMIRSALATVLHGSRKVLSSDNR